MNCRKVSFINDEGSDDHVQCSADLTLRGHYGGATILANKGLADRSYVCKAVSFIRLTNFH